MATGSRARPTASGPTVGPRGVANGVSPWAAADLPRTRELRFVALELLTLAVNSGPAAGGICIAKLSVPGDRVWQIERIAVSSTSATVTTATVYVGGVDPANMVDFTPAGNGDIADETQPILVPGNSVVQVRWTGATDNSVGTVHFRGWAGAVTEVPL